jgi:ubiquitin carboxyl-terminal hydrolase 22/27/51
VYHEIFDQEKERIDIIERLPYQAWKSHSVQRSFDPLCFLHVEDHGIMWKGMIATYPPLVPREHVLAARLCRRRQILFGGEVGELSLLESAQAKAFAALNKQNRK